jgi:hypothetical protein
VCLSCPTRTGEKFTSANITSSAIGISGYHFAKPFEMYGPFDNATLTPEKPANRKSGGWYLCFRFRQKSDWQGRISRRC